MGHLISSEVSQNAVVMFWNTRSLNGLCCLGFLEVFLVFFGSSAGKVNKHVHISMSGESEPTCCCLTTEQLLPTGNYRSKLRKSISPTDLQPGYVRTQHHTCTNVTQVTSVHYTHVENPSEAFFW